MFSTVEENFDNIDDHDFYTSTFVSKTMCRRLRKYRLSFLNENYNKTKKTYSHCLYQYTELELETKVISIIK